MKFIIFKALFLALAGQVLAGVSINEKKLGDSLGGWKKRGEKTVEYPLSGATYRTYRPEITPTPDDGIFISVRIDHVRGWFSSDDHAVLEITVDKEGRIVSAQSSIAIQGKSVTSDVIRGGTDAGIKTVGVDRAVEIGTDLVADVSEKMLREKIVEAGRVSFPAVLRHNYNLLYQAIEVVEKIPKAIEANPLNPPAPPEDEDKLPDEGHKLPDEGQNQTLEIRPYGESEEPELPVEKSD